MADRAGIHVPHSPLQRSLAALKEQCGSDLGPKKVIRVHVDANGTVQVEVLHQRARRWFQFEENTLSECIPKDDKKIPLSDWLRAIDHELTIQLLSYRPGRRLVIASQHEGAIRIVKGYRRGRSKTAASRHNLAHNAWKSANLRVPRLHEHWQSQESLVTAHVSGNKLLMSDDQTGCFFAIGEGLRQFQDFPLKESFDKFGIDDELRVLDEWARRCLLATRELPDTWDRTRRRSDDLSKQLPPAHLGFTHRDLHDGQIINTGMRSGMILDFDLLCVADVALDAANFLAHLTLRAMQGVSQADDSSVNFCGKAFLDGLDRNKDEDFWMRLRYYEATSFFRLALLQGLHPRWVGLTPHLIAIGHRCLDDVQRNLRRP